MIDFKRWLLVFQHAILFTCFAFVVPYASAFLFVPNGKFELNKDLFVTDLGRAMLTGVMIAIVLLARDQYLRRRKNATVEQ